MNVSLQQLKVFVAVARARSFTRAAREFGLTQSAVSRCVRELEEAVELKLFDRTTRQVELTLAGSGFERRIGRLLDEIEMALNEGRDAHQAHSGVVLVASNPVLSSTWVPAALARCAAAFPSLTLQLQDLPQAAVLQAVEQGEADFGVIAESVPFASGNLDVQPLSATPLCALLPAHHPLALQGALRWDDLAREPLVTLNRDAGCRGAVMRALDGLRPEGRPLQEFAHVAGVARMAQLGMGIGVLPVCVDGARGGHAHRAGDVAHATCHWPAPAGPLVTRLLHPVVNVTTMLVRRRHRSLRPCAEEAWAQFMPDGPVADGAVAEGSDPEVSSPDSEALPQTAIDGSPMRGSNGAPMRVALRGADTPPPLQVTRTHARIE
ncbi:LysR family transcriptional regulator [Paraburkholderia sp. CNPSo 3272]|uniref:LysR family transcriptional regulator n=1 Tax=Paraburkholderia sp. CNPSo 3272 TaxID=2940931 RepID=UPI0020B7D10E|nr:LysR family transcriptional regulator [Paraburkholderia sp. CNPSo 3272]MCP3724360.1 LysR family transcriptional regulator [Paraburkholderia sp. CNPSo 3272]